MTTGKLQKKAEDFQYGEIELLDVYKNHAIDLELAYLQSLEPDRLLAGFYETAGKKAKALRYGGWEVTEIQGHTLGHYLTAIAQAYAYTGEEEFRKRAEYMVSCLLQCQRADGFLFASKEEIFDRVENKKPAWVPWYTMHKILEGLISAYVYTKNEEAKTAAAKLGNWIYSRCSSWSEETRKTVLAVEYGGMNDCLYDLYEMTGEKCYIEAAHQFDELSLFREIHEGRDVLNGLHANTTIPKMIGAMKRYMVLGRGEEFYLETAERFWDLVVSHHTYITGGNSEWEHFGRPGILDEERTACNCETCNTYNMLKLSKGLFEITGERKYADFYENALLNAILSSQNPETGMTTYFQPMAAGYFKVYSTPYDSFWCCTGSGMENFTKLSEGFAYKGQKEMYLIRCEDSRVFWKEKGLKLEMKCRQEEDAYEVKLQVLERPKDPDACKIRLLIPQWNAKAPGIRAEGIQASVEKDWIVLEGGLDNGNTLTVTFCMELRCSALPDNPHALAFSYGPYVLSGALGEEKKETVYTGVDVLVPKKDSVIEDYIVLKNISLKEFKENIGQYFKKEKGRMAFTLEEEKRTLTFLPHYSRYKERYGIYWIVCEEGDPELEIRKERALRRQRLEQEQTDVIPVGNDQYELAHRIHGAFTDSEKIKGHPGRFCTEGGWFSYEMKIPGEGGTLCMTLSKEDAGNVFTFRAGSYVTEEIQVEDSERDFYIKEIVIPEGCAEGNNTIVVKFQYKQGICRIFDELYMKKTGEEGKRGNKE